MSERIKHECGIVLIRLKKEPEYYRKKYGTENYGLAKLYLMMEKQHNRGQEGAGVGCININAEPGSEYIYRARAMGSGAIREVFSEINQTVMRHETENPGTPAPFDGNIYIGHLRYSTTGRSGISYTHPFLRRNNWRSRNLCLVGNFNLTNVDQVMEHIISCGQHPRHNADTFIILEQLGYMLDEEVETLYKRYKSEGYAGAALSRVIEQELDLTNVLTNAASIWDGGFVITGATGSGDSFIFRDRWGIRPAFWYSDAEVFVAASERAVIQTVMNVDIDSIRELEPGHSIIIKGDGSENHRQILPPATVKPCSFERIYFSRGSDRDIYYERKKLGSLLTDKILESVDYDIDNTVFSFIPNTAEAAYYGMMDGLNEYLNRIKAQKIAALGACASVDSITEILSHKIRTEKLAVKDIKLRTFIAEGADRNDLAAHVYDTTYGTIVPGRDNVVVIDDSIVRGTTLKQSIISILSRLRPKKIVVVSSSPQIRYPDCYGIDMSSMGEFIAFNAAIELLRENGMDGIIDDVYRKCKSQCALPKEECVNYVREIYTPFSDEDISRKIARMIIPESCRAEVSVVFQSIEGLHRACPRHNGDWYFSGDYPTPGGNRVVSRAFVNYYEGSAKRAL